MSLESVLADLVVALNANTAALKGAAVTTMTVSASEGAAVTVTPTEEVKKTRKTKETPAAAPVPEVKQEPAAPAPAPVVYPTVNDVRSAAQALLDANENKDDGLFAQINAKYGTKKISESPEAVRAEVIAQIKAKTAEVIAAKANSAASAV